MFFKPLALVPSALARRAIDCLASLVNSISMLSKPNRYCVCLIRALRGSVNIFTNCSSVSVCMAVIIENLPTNSGIKPYLIRSSGLTSCRWLASSSICKSLPKPMPVDFFDLITFSSSVNAPPTMNSMFCVLIFTVC